MPKSTYFIVANTYNENDDLSVIFLMDITKHGGAIFTLNKQKAKKYPTKQSAVNMLIEGMETGEWERSTLTEQGEDTDALNCFGVIRELKGKKNVVAGSTDIAPLDFISYLTHTQAVQALKEIDEGHKQVSHLKCITPKCENYQDPRESVMNQPFRSTGKGRGICNACFNEI